MMSRHTISALATVAAWAVAAGTSPTFLHRSFGSTAQQLQPGRGAAGPSVGHLCVGAAPVVFLNHTLSEGAVLGVVDHFWMVAGSEVAMAEQGVQLQVGHDQPQVSARLPVVARSTA